MLIQNKTVQCPYCGEIIDVLIDTSVEQQDYIEDCSVCCRPIEFSVAVLDDVISVTVRTNDE
jgi:transcription elongation factor Elf1